MFYNGEGIYPDGDTWGSFDIFLGDHEVTVFCPRSRVRDLANELMRAAAALVDVVDNRAAVGEVAVTTGDACVGNAGCDRCGTFDRVEGSVYCKECGTETEEVGQ